MLGAGLWYATYRGRHPPDDRRRGARVADTRPPVPAPGRREPEARRTADETSDEPDPADADAPRWLRLAWLSREAVSPLARTEHALLPWTSFVILPLFALANAGVELSLVAARGRAHGAGALGIFVGLVVGKPIGVLVGVLARRALGRRSPSTGRGMGHMTGMGATAGIGFTVALFIAELAFPTGRGCSTRRRSRSWPPSVIAGRRSAT